MPGQALAHGREADSQAAALLAARAALDKHAEGVVVMDLRTLSSITDFFVICTAESSRQLSALKDHIEAVLHQHGTSVWHTEGTAVPSGVSPLMPPSQWVLMDCGDVVVHLFDPHGRNFYRLEELWADAPRVPLSALSSGASPS